MQGAATQAMPVRIPILFDRSQPVIGYNMIADVEHNLDGKLEVPLDVPKHKRVLDEFRASPAAEDSQIACILAQFCEALANDDGISQRRSPLRDVS
jgi:hypothetical protein